MKIPLSLAVLLLLEAHGTQGFVLSASKTPSSTHRQVLAGASPEEGGTSKPVRTKPMSPEEIKARVRENQGLPPEEEDEPPKLFSEELYEDMRQTLLTLERRVSDGPGSISMLDVEEMTGRTQRIVAEMKDFETGRVTELAAQPATVDVTAAPVSAAVTTPAVVEAAVVEEEEGDQVDDDGTPKYTHTDEGPAYDGTGGLGMPKGTRNTYVIPGMESMSPEEYQDALQKSIIDRQKERSRDGNYGNRATWDYLNNLSGDKGVLKDDEEAP